MKEDLYKNEVVNGKPTPYCHAIERLQRGELTRRFVDVTDNEYDAIDFNLPEGMEYVMVISSPSNHAERADRYQASKYWLNKIQDKYGFVAPHCMKFFDSDTPHYFPGSDWQSHLISTFAVKKEIILAVQMGNKYKCKSARLAQALLSSQGSPLEEFALGPYEILRFIYEVPEIVGPGFGVYTGHRYRETLSLDAFDDMITIYYEPAWKQLVISHGSDRNATPDWGLATGLVITRS